MVCVVCGTIGLRVGNFEHDLSSKVLYLALFCLFYYKDICKKSQYCGLYVLGIMDTTKYGWLDNSTVLEYLLQRG